MPVALQSFFQQNASNRESVMAIAVIMPPPPLIVFNRYFSVGGIGGALAGQ